MTTDRPSVRGPRHRLVRDAAVLQLKLIVDGVRDAALIPVSLLAAALGLIRGGEDADREFRQVLKWGRRSERWIDLFGRHTAWTRRHPGRSLDALVDRVEDVVAEEYRKGRDAEHLRSAIRNAIEDGGERGPEARDQ